MRIVYLAVVGCAGLFCACDLDQRAFERNVEAGVSAKDKDKDDNGGADLIPSDKPARPGAMSPRSAAAPAAADGGMRELAPDAAAPPEAAPDAEMPDAGPSDPNPASLAADGGITANPEDDAGTPEPEPAPCLTHDCHCETYCRRGAALDCPEDPPLADCIALCQLPIKAGCEAQELAAMRCKAELPADKYICDEDLLTFFVLGCQAEDLAARSCRTR